MNYYDWQDIRCNAKCNAHNDGYIEFRIVGWATFRLRQDGRLQEQVEQARYGGFAETARSRWLHAISLGKKRDDAGNIA